MNDNCRHCYRWFIGKAKTRCPKHTSSLVQQMNEQKLAQLHLVGQPTMSIDFIGLPSVNTHYGQNRWAKAQHTAEWRYEAREKAYEHTLWLDDFLIKRALVVVNVFPPYEEIMDIHNVWVKAVLDGFSDAEVWSDDEWAFVPLVLFAWAGIGEQKPRQHKIRRTRIDVYELDAYIVGGQRQTLPRGRKRL